MANQFRAPEIQKFTVPETAPPHHTDKEVCAPIPKGKMPVAVFCGAANEGDGPLKFCSYATDSNHEPECSISWIYVDGLSREDNNLCLYFHNTSKKLTRHIGIVVEVEDDPGK